MEAATEKYALLAKRRERGVAGLGLEGADQGRNDQVLDPMQWSVRMTDPIHDCIRLPWWDA
jgi:hypothetical protein